MKPQDLVVSVQETKKVSWLLSKPKFTCIRNLRYIQNNLNKSFNRLDPKFTSVESSVLADHTPSALKAA